MLMFLYIFAGISPFDLSALVTSPKGVSEAAETAEIEEGLFGVRRGREGDWGHRSS